MWPPHPTCESKSRLPRPSWLLRLTPRPRVLSTASKRRAWYVETPPSGPLWTAASLSAQSANRPDLQEAIRDFLKVRTSYDVLPLSFRLILLDTDLLIKKSLNILLQNCAPIHL